MFETVLLAAHPTGGLAHTPIGITPYPLRAPHSMTGCAMLPADHDKRYGFRTLRAREHRSKRVRASSSILRAPSHVSSFVVARCLLALFMFDVPALARIHERCTHDSVRRLREVVSFPLWFAPSPSKPAGKRTNNVARDGVPGVRGEGTGGHADSGPVGERRKSNRPRIDSERGACGVGRGACPCIGRGSLHDKTSSSFGQGVPVHRESPPYARMPLPW
ncbi:hypothetical protein BPSG_0651 [Bifidobacterium pseudolongum subsp. globosum]|nr:hypothetical protein BPSG_0651 [Bifidobacterium pseudolongum subsp. globosum]